MNPRTLPSHLQRAHTTKISLGFSEPINELTREIGDIRYWRVRYPGLASTEDETAIGFLRGRLHSRGVGSMIRFSESLELKKRVRKQQQNL